MSENKINPMKEIHISKVVINIGVGKSGDPVEKAKNALSELTGKTPSVRGAKKSVRDFGIHKGEPIGAMVTLRRTDATNFLRRIMESKRNVIKNSSFDNNGNISLNCLNVLVRFLDNYLFISPLFSNISFCGFVSLGSASSPSFEPDKLLVSCWFF